MLYPCYSPLGTAELILPRKHSLGSFDSVAGHFSNLFFLQGRNFLNLKNYFLN